MDCFRYTRFSSVMARVKFRWSYFFPALIGRLAQDSAECLSNDDPMRQHLLSISFRAEDWFEAQSRETYCARDLAPGVPTDRRLACTIRRHFRC
jgi:hypothetical protein